MDGKIEANSPFFCALSCSLLSVCVCSEEMVEEAIKRHTTDNISCVCVCLSESAPPELKRQKSTGRGGMSKRTLSSSAVCDLQNALLGVELDNSKISDNNRLGIDVSGNSETALSKSTIQE